MNDAKCSISVLQTVTVDMKVTSRALQRTGQADAESSTLQFQLWGGC